MSDTMTNAPRRRGRPARTADVNIENGAASVNTTEPAPAAVVERSAMRPPVREEDPRARAAARAAQIKGHLGELDEGVDDFITPPPPPGWTYEWKRKTIYNQEDPAYQVSLARMGWEAVPTTRHPEMMPGGGSHANIERKGMILMERPAEITEEVRAADLRKARNQVRAKEAQLNNAPDGQFGRDHAQVKPKINKGYSPIDIPSDK
jgi:hypothetical protein